MIEFGILPQERKEQIYMIYCVEDDSSIRDLMIYTLNSAGFEAKGFDGADTLLTLCRQKNPSLLCLI